MCTLGDPPQTQNCLYPWQADPATGHTGVIAEDRRWEKGPFLQMAGPFFMPLWSSSWVEIPGKSEPQLWVLESELPHHLPESPDSFPEVTAAC